jgi:hypothetical protein
MLGPVPSGAGQPLVVSPCPTLCGTVSGPLLLTLKQQANNRLELGLLVRVGGPLELTVVRRRGLRLAEAPLTLINNQPRELLAGRFPRGGHSKTLESLRLPAMARGLRSRLVTLRRKLAAGLYRLAISSISGKGKLRAAGSSIVVRVGPRGGMTPLLEPHLAPIVTTGTATSITQNSAWIAGTVLASGSPTKYYFQYGATTTYGARTAIANAGRREHPVSLAVPVKGLSAGTVYHFRLVATNCSGCRSGTTYGGDATFPTVASTTQQLDAERAVTTYNAMQSLFYVGDGSSLYSENYPPSGNKYSFLWPFTRALDGTITLAGIPSSLVGGASYQPDVADRLTGLSRYWDSSSSGPGYDSYPPAPYGNGGDKYYDDAAWVGLALAQDYRLTANTGALNAAQSNFSFIYPGGLATNDPFETGGIYWVQQNTGTVGRTNHDRTTNSTAPNAENALLLAALDPANAAAYDSDASTIYEWVNHYLYNVPNTTTEPNPTDPLGPNPNYVAGDPALMFDKVKGGNAIDTTLWTYNQGSMIALDAREWQATGQIMYLNEAEAIANAALNAFTESQYLQNQPAAFNAIFFRGLLVLYSVIGDSSLQSRILQTIQTYADDAWTYYRSPNGLFRFPSSSGSGYQLLDQGAMLQIYAMLAWSAADYNELP